MANLSTVCTIMWGKWRQNLHSRLFLCLFDYLKWNILLVLINTFSDKLIMTLPLFLVDISHNETTMHGILKLNWYCFFQSFHLFYSFVLVHYINAIMISALIYIDDLFVKPLKTPVGGKVFESDRLQGHSLITIPNSCSCVCIKENLFIWLKAYSGRMLVLKKKTCAIKPNVQRFLFKISYQFNQLAKGHV